MPEKLREIILLAYFHKFSYAEIARILEIPVGTVKSRLHTAVSRFAEDWEIAVVWAPGWIGCKGGTGGETVA